MRFSIFSFVLATFSILLSESITINNRDCSVDKITNYSTPMSLSRVTTQRKQRNAIMLLLPEFYQVLDGFTCSRPCSIVDKHAIIKVINMIDENLMDKRKVDLIIFHEGYPAVTAIQEIRHSTMRNVDFVNIDSVFLQPPNGVDPYGAAVGRLKRGKWRQQQAARFMLRDVFKFPVLNNVKYLMKIDFDACFLNGIPNILGALLKQSRQQAITYVSSGEAEEFSERQIESLRRLLGVTDVRPSLKAVQSSLEILSVDFFRSEPVQTFAEQIVQSGGLFTEGWDIGLTRALTLSLFSDETAVLQTADLDVQYSRPCPTERRSREQY